MKRLVGFVFLFATLSIPGFARSGNSATVKFSTSLRIGAKDIAPGDYKMTWTGLGPEVQVSFSQGKKVIVTAPAKLVQQQNDGIAENTADGVGVDTTQQGSTTFLQEIQLSKLSLLFDSDVKAEQ